MESCYIGLQSIANNKNKEDKRTSNDLNTNNSLSDIATGFQNDWPLSNSDVKLMKKQQDNVKALENFFTKLDEDVGERNQFLNMVWSNKAKMPSLYPEKSVTWEAQIYNAFNEAGIDIGMWFVVDMAKNRKAIHGTSAGGWFQNEGEK
jgi:small-conductance mechanosensitive channel